MLIEAVSPYQAEYERAAVSRTSEPRWLQAVRARAWARFSALGFPTTRQEEWRFTNVSPLATRAFTLSPAAPDPVSAGDLAPFRFADSGAIEIVLVNGSFVPRLSALSGLPRGVLLTNLRDALSTRGDWLARHLGRAGDAETRPFQALNTALLGDGAVIEIAARAVLDQPLHVIFFNVPTGIPAMTHPRVLVVAGASSQCRLVESYAAPAGAGVSGREPGSFTNAVTEILLGEHAVVDHYRVQREAFDAAHVSATNVRLSRGGAYTSHAFTFGGGLVRNDVIVTLDGEGADCTLNGLYVADGSRLVDDHTLIDHAAPHCGSRELYKGILDGRARAVFAGKIRVRPGAQKTDAKQTNKTLLLSDDAQINTKPQLEIFANDVKCTHGATVGQLNADALFYLQSRGIGREEARRMLIRAFASDITGRVRIDGLREHLDTVLLASLDGALGGREADR